MFVSVRHGGPPPRRCAGRGKRGVINNFGDTNDTERRADLSTIAKLLVKLNVHPS